MQAALRVLAEIGHAGAAIPRARDALRRRRARGARARWCGLIPAWSTELLANRARPLSRWRRATRRRSCSSAASTCVFASVGGPAYVMDNDRGRRDGTYAEMCDYLRLIQSLNILHQEGGGPFEPLDLPANTRHLDIYHAADHAAGQELADPDAGPRPHDGRDRDGGDRAGHHARGADRDRPALLGIINTNSPLQLDVPMAEGLIALAEPRAGQRRSRPSRWPGAMAPVTLAGALVQQHAEAMAGIVLTQIVRPGRAGDVWRLHLERRHALGRAGLRHAGIHQGGAGDAGSWRAISACRSGRRTSPRRTRSMRRRPTKARWRSGAR